MHAMCSQKQVIVQQALLRTSNAHDTRAYGIPSFMVLSYRFMLFRTISSFVHVALVWPGLPTAAALHDPDNATSRRQRLDTFKASCRLH